MTSETTRTAIQNEQDYIFQTYLRPGFVLERGEGVYLYDTEGTRYLDFVAGIGVNALGHNDPDIVRTIAEQAPRLIHVSNLYHTIPGSELARLLVETSQGFSRVFFCNSGSEAIEGALKFSRRYARAHYGEGKTTVVAFDGSFHGRSMGAVAITSREKYRQPFMPVMPDVRFASFNNTSKAALDAAITDEVCAVVVEPVQGEGGLRVASDDFLQQLRARCDAHGALLVVDEIQCGMGRTGLLWAHQYCHIEPDILAAAKPLGGGLPIGAILAKQHVADALAVGEHGTTFGGGPLATSVAQVVLRRISDPLFLTHVQRMSITLDQHLQSLAADFPQQVMELRGRGLMRGVCLAEAGKAATVRQECHHRGLMVATSGEDVIRLLPPLIIEETHIIEAMTTLREAIQAAC